MPSRRIDESLLLEWEAHRAKRPETEEAYYEAWCAIPEIRGEPGMPARGPNAAFIVHSASLLAHVQLLRGVARESDTVFVLNGDTEGFRNLLPCVAVALPQVPLSQRFEALRERMAERGCGTMIWVSVPVWARYAFSLRLAARQVYWAMRFHPIAPGDINITGGARGERERVFHGVSWRCVHAPFNVELRAVDRVRCEAQRAPYAYIYGTVAREEKLTPEYLDAVCEILAAHPEAGFCWTGRTERPEVRRFFRERGLSNRQWFSGWVDPDEFVNAMDCFLETFPLGGLTTFTAMGHGVPVVALRQEHSPVGSLEDGPVALVAARGRDEYVSMALALRHDAARDRNVAAGREIFDSETRKAQADKDAFWRVIYGV